ncbi:MAG: glycosyltransferase family 4 protein [Variibacter sp.]
MAESTVVMSFHPLTAPFTARLRALFGSEMTTFNAADLRHKSFLAGLRDLWTIKTDRLIVAVEQDNALPLAIPLSIAAAFTRARDVRIVWPDLRVEPLPRLAALGKVVSVLRDTLQARASLRRNRRTRAMMKDAAARAVSPARGQRVLFIDANISLGAPVGGSIGHTAGVISGFLDEGFSVDYASVRPLPLVREGATWLRLSPPSLTAIPAELNYYPYMEMMTRVLSERHAQQPWSFIYQRFSLHSFVGTTLGRKLDIPIVLEFNGSEAWSAAYWGERLALHDDAVATERTALTTADLLVAVSDALYEDIRRHDIPNDRVAVYPNCVDPKVFDPARFGDADIRATRAHYGIADDARVVGFIGTFGLWHGVEFLAECIRDLVASDRAWIEENNLHFMFVGDGLKMPVVRETLKDASSFATLTGLVPQAEAPLHLAAMDILVSPHVPNADGSAFFGSPTKLFEYMAMERPIVASALEQIDDVMSGRGATKIGRLPVGAGTRCGLTFTPGDKEAFKAALREIVENRALGEELAMAARKEVLARYTWRAHVCAILDRMDALHLIERAAR